MPYGPNTTYLEVKDRIDQRNKTRSPSPPLSTQPNCHQQDTNPDTNPDIPHQDENMAKRSIQDLKQMLIDVPSVVTEDEESSTQQQEYTF